jgi:hypothetical protein
MPLSPVPADPWWDDDPAWSRPDPMTAAELEASLDWTCEHGEPPGDEEYEDFEPLTAEELMGTAGHLDSHLPGTRAALRDGTVSLGKARIIPVRRRAQHPLRGRRPDVLVQHRPEVPPRPPPQTAPQVEGRPAPRRRLPLDHPGRPHLHHRTHPLPDLAASF